jgi:hypothetical protein
MSGLLLAPITLLPAKNFRYNLNRGWVSPRADLGASQPAAIRTAVPQLSSLGIIVTELSLLVACMGEITNGYRIYLQF